MDVVLTGMSDCPTQARPQINIGPGTRVKPSTSSIPTDQKLSSAKCIKLMLLIIGAGMLNINVMATGIKLQLIQKRRLWRLPTSSLHYSLGLYTTFSIYLHRNGLHIWKGTYWPLQWYISMATWQYQMQVVRLKFQTQERSWQIYSIRACQSGSID